MLSDIEGAGWAHNLVEKGISEIKGMKKSRLRGVPGAKRRRRGTPHGRRDMAHQVWRMRIPPIRVVPEELCRQLECPSSPRVRRGELKSVSQSVSLVIPSVRTGTGCSPSGCPRFAVVLVPNSSQSVAGVSQPVRGVSWCCPSGCPRLWLILVPHSGSDSPLLIRPPRLRSVSIVSTSQ